MCDFIICEDPHLARMVGLDDRRCCDLTYDDINQDVCENVVLGLKI